MVADATHYKGFKEQIDGISGFNASVKDILPKFGSTNMFEPRGKAPLESRSYRFFE